MLVKDCIKTLKDKDHNIWLCPNIVSNQTINIPNYLRGNEFASVGAISEDILNKTVVKHWLEDGFLCIVWKNE